MIFRYTSFFLLFLLLSCEKANKLFEKVEAKNSGLFFENTVTSGAEMNAFNFTNFYNGGGVGIGDFNKDGLKDIILTGNQVQPGVFVNKGDLKFEDISGKSGVVNTGWVTGVSIIDINQDGWDDIYLSMASHPSLKSSSNQLYINQKTSIPTFKEQAAAYGLAYSGFTVQTVFFDYDLDGDLDAYLLNTEPDILNPNYLRPQVNNGTFPSSDKLFENKGVSADNGFAQFVDVSEAAGIVYEGLGLGIALSDFNNDGYVDIYCSNDFQSNDIFYLNQGNGTFKNIINEAVKHTSLYGMGVDAVDLNNDRYTDLMQLDMLPESNERQKQMIARGDYDKKVISTKAPYNYMLQYMRNSLQLNQGINNGIPNFSEVGLAYGVAKTDWSWSILAADYDLDGFKDLFISNGYRKNVTDLDFITYKNQSMFGSESAKENRNEELLKNVPEIILQNYAFKNDSLNGFLDVSQEWGLNESAYANGAAYADLDNDGDLDLIVNNIDALVSLFENKTVSPSFVKVSFDGAANGIGAKAVAWQNGSAQQLENFPCRGYISSLPQELIFGLGKEKMLDSLEIIWPGGASKVLKKVASGTVLTPDKSNGNTKEYISPVMSPLFKDVSEILNYSHIPPPFIDFNQNPALHKMQTTIGPAFALGDFNNDGFEDLVFGEAMGGNSTQIYLLNVKGFKEVQDFPTSNYNTGKVLVFDADNDLDLDFLLIPFASNEDWKNENSYQVRLFLNDGKAHFTLDQKFPRIIASSCSAIAFDFDKDGDQDVVIAGHHQAGKYPVSAASFVLQNDQGKFKKVEHTIASILNQFGLVKDLINVDYDNDGDEDLVAVGEWMPPILLQNSKQDFQLKYLDISKSGWWNSVSPVDIDNDGDMDFILGNEGLNTLFRASEKEPVRLLVKDFNADGKMDPLIAHYIQGEEVPFAALGTLTEQVVQFKQKFQSFTSYSKASFKDLFSKDDLSGVIEKKANYLQSAVAINDKGKFNFKPLPLAAQTAPIQSIIAKDFDKDGLVDLLISGGFYPNESSLGQQDAMGGLFLKGLGNGNFKKLNLAYMVEGDARRSMFFPKSELVVTATHGGKAYVHQWLSK